MKNQSELLKALTHYNDDAQLDEQKIANIKKARFEKEIAVSNRIRLHTSTDFAPKPINISFMNSSFVNDNINFKEIKLAFLNYNLEAANLNEDEIDERHLRPNLMDSLLKYMRLVMLTEDRPAQVRMLAIINAWYKDKLSKRDYKNKLQREFDRELEIRLEEARLAAKPPTSTLPSEIIRNQKASYLRKFRTLHEDIHAPGERLKDIKRRILNFEETELKPSSVPPANRIKYQRPPPLIFHKDLPDIPNESTSKQMKPNNTSIITNAGNISTDATDAQTSQQALRTEPTEVVKPEDIQQEEFMLGEEPGEEEFDGQLEPDLPDQQGKLDPHTKNYIYPPNAFNRSAEIRMNERVMRIQSDFERRNIEDQAKYQATKNWSKQRCRLQAELSRKIESVRQFAKVDRIPKLKTEPKEKFTNLVKQEQSASNPRFEDSIDNERLGDAKRYGLRYLNYQKGQIISHSKGLSVFDRKRAKTEQRSLSQILHEHSRERQRDSSFGQIEEIKNRFAKYKIPIQLKRVSDGLLHPREIQPERLTMIGPVDVGLPSNPFMKVAKKKRKGKKR